MSLRVPARDVDAQTIRGGRDCVAIDFIGAKCRENEAFAYKTCARGEESNARHIRDERRPLALRSLMGSARECSVAPRRHSSALCVENNNVFIIRASGTSHSPRRGEASPQSRMDEPVNARPRSPLRRNIVPPGDIGAKEVDQLDFSPVANIARSQKNRGIGPDERTRKRTKSQWAARKS